ncbi:hypothetical protein JAAARDRAFT_200258 [Jaapia argillacea MUCL 33604]|uniref:Uncharacterized protein n=1 Tax=Jaapia argillacea MUCL 33604 TaxID=933084 RepID=A0A067P5P9_9AGAM|nr:hypothetical protein JAAARDRAFT_200258 [Jaapia argillacea MUCL 33604]
MDLELHLDEEHPLALELASLRAAVERYQHETYTTSLTLQRTSLDASHSLTRLQSLERENAALHSELNTLRSTPPPPPSSTHQQTQTINELTLSLRHLSAKLDYTTSSLLEREHQLAEANAEVRRAEKEKEAAYELAARARAREEDVKVRLREVEGKRRVLEEEGRMMDLVVREYADLVRKLEGRGTSLRSSSGSGSSISLGSTANGSIPPSPSPSHTLNEGKTGLVTLLTEFNTETSSLHSEISRLSDELDKVRVELDVEREVGLKERDELAKVRIECDRMKGDDSAAAKVVSRYMKFSQSTTDTLQTSLESLKTRQAATLSTLSTQITSLEHTLTQEKHESSRLRDMLDELTEDISRESYGRRREVALRLKMLGREEGLVEGLRRWVRRGKEELDRVDGDGDEDEEVEKWEVLDSFERVVKSGVAMLESLDGGRGGDGDSSLYREGSGDGEEGMSAGSLGRVLAAESAVGMLVRELEVEMEKRMEVVRRLGELGVGMEGLDGEGLDEGIRDGEIVDEVVRVSGDLSEDTRDGGVIDVVPQDIEVESAARAPPTDEIKEKLDLGLQVDQLGIGGESESLIDLPPASHSSLSKPDISLVQIFLADRPEGFVQGPCPPDMENGDSSVEYPRAAEVGSVRETSVELTIGEGSLDGAVEVTRPNDPVDGNPLIQELLEPSENLLVHPSLVEGSLSTDSSQLDVDSAPTSEPSIPVPAETTVRPPSLPDATIQNTSENTAVDISSIPNTPNRGTLGDVAPSSALISTRPEQPLETSPILGLVSFPEQGQEPPVEERELEGEDLMLGSEEVVVVDGGSVAEDVETPSERSPSSAPATPLLIITEPEPPTSEVFDKALAHTLSPVHAPSPTHTPSLTHTPSATHIPLSEHTARPTQTPSPTPTPPLTSRQAVLLASLLQVKDRYDDLQRSFRNCHLALKDLKSTLSSPSSASSSSMLPLLKTAVGRLDDYNEDTRVELEIRVADEERIVRGYQTLLSVPGAISDEVEWREVEGDVRKFVDGGGDREKVREGFGKKLDDLQNDIAVIKRTFYEIESTPSPSTPSTPSGGWSTWTSGLLGGGGSPSRPATPAKTFGNVMTSPRLRHPNLDGTRKTSASHDSNPADPFGSLGLRIPMPSYVPSPPRPETTTTIRPQIGMNIGIGTPPPGQRQRTISGMYMLGLGSRRSSMVVQKEPVTPTKLSTGVRQISGGQRSVVRKDEVETETETETETEGEEDTDVE